MSLLKQKINENDDNDGWIFKERIRKN